MEEEEERKKSYATWKHFHDDRNYVTMTISPFYQTTMSQTRTHIHTNRKPSALSEAVTHTLSHSHTHTHMRTHARTHIHTRKVNCESHGKFMQKSRKQLQQSLKY